MKELDGQVDVFASLVVVAIGMESEGLASSAPLFNSVSSTAECTEGAPTSNGELVRGSDQAGLGPAAVDCSSSRSNTSQRPPSPIRNHALRGAAEAFHLFSLDLDVTSSGGDAWLHGKMQGLDDAFQKLCGKKVRGSLSSFLPGVAASSNNVDNPSSSEDSLRSLVEKPPIGGCVLDPLAREAFRGFLLRPGPVPEQFRMISQPSRKKSKHKRHKHHHKHLDVPTPAAGKSSDGSGPATPATAGMPAEQSAKMPAAPNMSQPPMMTVNLTGNPLVAGAVGHDNHERKHKKRKHDSPDRDHEKKKKKKDRKKKKDKDKDKGIVEKLCCSDAQLFSGFRDYMSVMDRKILNTVDNVKRAAIDLLHASFTGQEKNAWLCSATFNSVLRDHGHKPIFTYLVSGGDEALIVSKELPEDDPKLGASELAAVVRGHNRVMFVGITCGLSAPYVAGQIDWALKKENVLTCLIGFNPVELSRDSVIEGWDKTCRQVFLDLSEATTAHPDSSFIVNPVVGPEPVTGSTRMKGGSMTKILLEAIFLTALAQAIPSTSHTNLHSSQTQAVVVMDVNRQSPNEKENGREGDEKPPTSCEASSSLLLSYQLTYHSAYQESSALSAIVHQAGECLSQPNGHLYYIGQGSFGILGLIDASEMVDTYGAGEDEVRAFLPGGWTTCGNKEGDMRSKGQLFCISVEDFEKDLLPTLTSSDLVVALLSDNGAALNDLWTRLCASPSRLARVLVTSRQSSATLPPLSQSSADLTLHLPTDSVMCGTVDVPVFAEFAMKLVINAISTGANVLKGRVHGNTMINVTVSNNKLFFRSIEIISELAGVDSSAAQTALLKAIYREDKLPEEILSLPVSAHVLAATTKQMVVPLSILLAKGSLSVANAFKQLMSVATLRNVATR